MIFKRRKPVSLEREVFTRQPEIVRLLDGILHSAKFTDDAYIRGQKESEETKIDICDALGLASNIVFLENLYAMAKKGMDADVCKRKAVKEDLDYWLREMSEEINEILGCSLQLPSIGFGKLKTDTNAVYCPFRQNITVSPFVDEYALPVTISHEYSHHVHDFSKYPLNWYFNEPLREGFCEGIAVHSVNKNISNNPRNNLVQAYEKLEKRIASFLYMHYNRRWNMQNGHYAIGAAAFAIAEDKYGSKLYHDMIRERKPAGMLVNILKHKVHRR